MERFSIKIAPKHIIFDYSWDKKETNKLFRLVCLFWSECNYRIWKNPVESMVCKQSQEVIIPNKSKSGAQNQWAPLFSIS